MKFGRDFYFGGEEIVEETGKNLSLDEPIVARTREIFNEVDSKISASRELDQSISQQNQGLMANSEPEETLDVHSQSSEGAPSQETLARLKAAVAKGSDQENSFNISEQKSETERPKFGISSLISRMSRSEAVSSASGIST